MMLFMSDTPMQRVARHARSVNCRVLNDNIMTKPYVRLTCFIAMHGPQEG